MKIPSDFPTANSFMNACASVSGLVTLNTARKSPSHALTTTLIEVIKSRSLNGLCPTPEILHHNALLSPGIVSSHRSIVT